MDTVFLSLRRDTWCVQTMLHDIVYNAFLYFLSRYIRNCLFVSDVELELGFMGLKILFDDKARKYHHCKTGNDD